MTRPNRLLLALLLLIPAGLSVATDASPRPEREVPDVERARAAYQNFVGLTGTWQAQSTKGWDEAVTYEVIARGTTVFERSTFHDDPAAAMATMYHLDGERLMLTHYCEAGNQPRMEATEISADGSDVTFELLDATNLASPNDGHMGRAHFRFHDDGTFTSRWSFYENGLVVWAEDIEHRRSPGEANAPDQSVGH